MSVRPMQHHALMYNESDVILVYRTLICEVLVPLYLTDLVGMLHGWLPCRHQPRDQACVFKVLQL